jgi:hypothetical protein
MTSACFESAEIWTDPISPRAISSTSVEYGQSCSPAKAGRPAPTASAAASAPIAARRLATRVFSTMEGLALADLCLGGLLAAAAG